MSLRIYGNRALKTLAGQETRPTLARVREAVFNIWQGTIENSRWLDLCAGIGSMGAEALARGAAEVVGIEKASRACDLIQHNWTQLASVEQRVQVIRGDILKKVPTLAGQQFDHIYFDPPYASDLYEPVLKAIAHYELLAPQGELAIEHDDRHQPDAWLTAIGDKFVECRYKRYGSTALTFFKVPDSSTSD